MPSNNPAVQFKWSEKYSVGIPEIDEQHKALFDLIEKIHTAIMEHKGTKASTEVLDELVDYTRVHFALEQSLMRMGKYPDYDNHCVLHHDLVAEVVALQEKVHSGTASISFELLHFLRNWLAKHILIEDKKYAQFFADHGHASFSVWANESNEEIQKQKKKWWKFW
ncbi:MAG: bacteriohemerythrin [Azoarcus sp.]|jgi:hemerythrin|nr:bacteriohemerythrin [Azoarcus sp.]